MSFGCGRVARYCEDVSQDKWPTTRDAVKQKWQLTEYRLPKRHTDSLVRSDPVSPFGSPMWVTILGKHVDLGLGIIGPMRTAEMLAAAEGDEEQTMLVWLLAALVELNQAECACEVACPGPGRGEFGGLLNEWCNSQYHWSVKHTLPTAVVWPQIVGPDQFMLVAAMARSIVHGTLRIALPPKDLRTKQG